MELSNSRTSSPPSHNHSSPSSSSTSKRAISSSITGKTCPICLTDISGHRPAILTKCFHAYCLRCLLRWSNYKRTCPLCTSPFESYFSSSSFRTHRLLPLRPHPDSPPPTHPRRHPVAVQRVLRRTREEINATNRRSRPVPHLRSFGQPRLVPADVIQKRAHQWRASIYKRGLRAVPFQEKNLSLSRMMSNRHREGILHRIEPWIWRELQAVLQDSDPTVMVHVATSLYLSSIEKTRLISFCADSEDTFLAPLRPFLGEWTNIFWHELRCFAESSFTMDTYDEVVEYGNSEDC